MEQVTLREVGGSGERMDAYLGNTRLGSVYLTRDGWVALGAFVFGARQTKGQECDECYPSAEEAAQALIKALRARRSRHSHNTRLSDTYKREDSNSR